MKSFLLIIALFLTIQKSLGAASIQENYIFNVPKLPSFGPTPVTWFFIRSGYFWNGSDAVQLSDIEWPSWDLQQVPVSLVPPVSQNFKLIILDEEKKLIQELALESSFSPEEYFSKASKKPHYFQIKLITNDSRLELTSPIYTWYSKRKIASCEITLSGTEVDFLKQSQISACISSISAYLKDDFEHKSQMYFIINWPIIKGRENISGVQSLDRELKSAARKKKAQFFSDRTRSNVFTAEFGLTQIETMPKIDFPAEEIKNHEMAVSPPDKQQAKSSVYTELLTNGAKLVVNSFYNDLEHDRRLESPDIADRKIIVQFVDASDQYKQIVIVETRIPEKRTGLLGFLRPWDLRTFAGYNTLSSSRGENSQLISLPSFEFSYQPKDFSFKPYLSYESGLISLQSKLAISEVKVGATRKTNWFPGSFYSFGFHQYTLSGENSGSTRLGGISSVSLGLGAGYRFEDWFFKPSASFLIGNSLSYDSRLDLGRFFKSSSDYEFYFGAYVGYSAYRGKVLNLLNVVETFGEDRLQTGVSFGWIGPDSF